MHRKQFLGSVIPLLAATPMLGSAMNLNQLSRMASGFRPSEKMPVLFMGHGSPMNAIEENEFVQGFRNLGRELPHPQAILCVSAHWETQGTFVTAMEHPRTIHDFGGFPQALFEVQYPAPGSPELARETQAAITSTEVVLDDKWGLDHGAWSVIKHLYPAADIPVIQLSLDATKPPRYHYELARELKALREKGVLIIGSGNMVHNLGLVDWRRLNETYAFDWALEASTSLKHWIMNDDHQSLVNFSGQGKALQLAVPTPEHFLPLLYTLALKDTKDSVRLFNDKPVAGSLTMTSVKIDQA